MIPQIQTFDIEIKSDGRWFHEGGEIKRMGLVKLFASVLSCDDDGRYWLTTPVEKGEITVQDAPFVVTKLRQEGSGANQKIYLTTNLDAEYLLSSTTPLVMRQSRSGDTKPYILLEKGLSAVVNRSVFYEMAEIAIQHHDEGQYDNAQDGSDGETLRLWSDGASFALAGEEGA